FAGCEMGQCVQTHNQTICQPDTNPCTQDPACNPQTGACDQPDRPASTQRPESDGNLCTTSGCESGSCVQTNNQTVCQPDTNPCTQDPACNPQTGACDHPNVPDSTPCPDSDGILCTTSGCESGSCVQTHNQTVCQPDTNPCTQDPACNPQTGACEHPNVPDSTPCLDSDGNLCTTSGCESGSCVQTHNQTVCQPDTNPCTQDPACNPQTGACDHPNVPDSTPCLDSDGNLCTTSGCESGSCVQTHNQTV